MKKLFIIILALSAFGFEQVEAQPNQLRGSGLTFFSNTEGVGGHMGNASTINLSQDRMDQYGIMRLPNGQIHRLNHYDAMRACPQGTHLPSFREAAMEFQSLGAQIKEYPAGTLIAAQVKPADRTPGFITVDPFINATAKGDFFTGDKRDNFWFDMSGYKQPQATKLNTENFWLSSVLPHMPNVALFSRFDGQRFGHYAKRDGKAAVRCVVNQ